jgi:hypothetical protein
MAARPLAAKRAQLESFQDQVQNGGRHWNFNGNSFTNVLWRLCPVARQERQWSGVADEQCDAVGGCGSWLSARYLEELASISILHVSPLINQLDPPPPARGPAPMMATNDGIKCAFR